MAVPRNKEELRALETFRPLVDDLKFGDGVLMRFLRARNLDQAKAEDMIRKYVVYKEEQEALQLVLWTPPIELLQFDIYLCGFDKESRPVLWVPHGIWPSGRDMFEAGFADDMVSYAKKLMEKLYQVAMLTKQQQFVALVDSEGLTFSKVYHEARNWKAFCVLLGLIKEYEPNYPELLHEAFMINTPKAFMWSWTFLRPCLAEATITKVHFYGGDAQSKAKCYDALFSKLPERVIPSKYGGTANTIHMMEDFLPVWEEHCATFENEDKDKLSISEDAATQL